MRNLGWTESQESEKKSRRTASARMRGEKKRGSTSRRRGRISANANTLEMPKT